MFQVNLDLVCQPALATSCFFTVGQTSAISIPGSSTHIKLLLCRILLCTRYSLNALHSFNSLHRRTLFAYEKLRKKQPLPNKDLRIQTQGCLTLGTSAAFSLAPSPCEHGFAHLSVWA